MSNYFRAVVKIPCSERSHGCEIWNFWFTCFNVLDATTKKRTKSLLDFQKNVKNVYSRTMSETGRKRSLTARRRVVDCRTDGVGRGTKVAGSALPGARQRRGLLPGKRGLHPGCWYQILKSL